MKINLVTAAAWFGWLFFELSVLTAGFLIGVYWETLGSHSISIKNANENYRQGFLDGRAYEQEN